MATKNERLNALLQSKNNGRYSYDDILSLINTKTQPATRTATTGATATPATAATATAEAAPVAAQTPAATPRFNFNLGGSLEEALQQLIDQYNAAPTYTSKTADQIKAQAESETGSYYDLLRLAARQAQERQDLALAQQAAGLDTSYGKVRDASAKNYRQAYSQADRQMLSRGMQRSSYAAQTLANLAQEGVEAQQDIWDQQAAAEANIAAQRAQGEGQLADTLRQYDASYASDVLKRQIELENQDYERRMQNAEYQNNLAAQIYGYLQNNLAWNGAANSGGYGGGYVSSSSKKSSGGSGGSSTAATTPQTTNSFLNTYNSLQDTINGLSNRSATSTASASGSQLRAQTGNGGAASINRNFTFTPLSQRQNTTMTQDQVNSAVNQLKTALSSLTKKSSSSNR